MNCCVICWSSEATLQRIYRSCHLVKDFHRWYSLCCVKMQLRNSKILHDGERKCSLCHTQDRGWLVSIMKSDFLLGGLGSGNKARKGYWQGETMKVSTAPIQSEWWYFIWFPIFFLYCFHYLWLSRLDGLLGGMSTPLSNHVFVQKEG